jgi:arylsulfatase A-like enzyme
LSFLLRPFLAALLGWLTLGLLSPVELAAADPVPISIQRRRQNPRPNLILIVADDLGWGDLGSYGQTRIRTPHLDRLAAEGMRFTQAYAGNTVCAPSRCALMTGRHSGHGRIRSNAQVPLLPDDVTIAESLRAVGYKTFAIGKWALGWEGTTGHPNRQGFDEFMGFLEQLDAHNYYPPRIWRNDDALDLPGNAGGARNEYVGDLFTTGITNAVRISVPKPFFLYFAPTLPHANNERGTNGMEHPGAGRYAREPWPLPERGKAEMISLLDDAVGQIVAALFRYQLQQDTLIFFTSDNGPHAEGGVKPDFFGSSGPFRGYKRDQYEGGIRVPLIAWAPGRIARGTTNATPVAAWDFLPTLAELARAPVPPGLDGLSFAPLLKGQPLTRRHEYLYWEFHERGYQQAIRADDWKGIRLQPGGPLELYNLATDPGETRNVAAEHAEQVQRLEGFLRDAADPFVAPTNQPPRPPWLPAARP